MTRVLIRLVRPKVWSRLAAESEGYLRRNPQPRFPLFPPPPC